MMLAALIGLMIALPLSAQVRTAPEGNSLPERQAPANAAPHAPPSDADEKPHKTLTRSEHQRFAQRVDLSEFRKLAVFDGGRAKILDTMAREHIERVYGKSRFKDQWGTGEREESFKYDPVFTLLDLIFDKPYYFDKPIIYVEVLRLREAMIGHLPPAEQETWKKRGRLTPLMLADPATNQAVSELSADVLLQRAIGQVRMAAMAFDRADATLDMISPEPGQEQWSHLYELTHDHGGDAHAGLSTQISNELTRLRSAWHDADAATVNEALRALSGLIPRVHPETYPPTWKRSAELIYNQTERFTIGYVGYLLGAIALLIAFAVQRAWLIRTGVALLLVGFAVHSLGMGVRIVLSGRWPIHNQYESFIAIAWLAVLVGMGLMMIKRQWLYGAAAAALGAAALLFANTVAIPSREVGQVAGILATSRILYVHVNMVLCSYGLIGLGFFVSLFYLLVHFTQGRRVAQFAATGLGTVAIAGPTSDDADADASSAPQRGRHAMLADLDKAQMVVLQLAFWILGMGVLLGAYWADHAWGRWWAWDPKETWALITWIIYLMVIHLRFAVKRRGLVTAWMSVLGFVVMLWTYWGVNLLLAGLHSYA